MSRRRTGLLARLAVTGAVIVGALLGVAAPANATLPGLPGFQPLPPVPSLDVARYTGDWWQLAAVPQLFNLQCAKDTVATYGVIDSLNISVKNRCTDYFGNRTGVDGNARINDTVTRAALRVSFPGVPTQGDPNGPTNYVVTYIADDYSWALVGDPARFSGFVLSRTPSVSIEQFRQIRSVVESRGYNSCLFLTSPTTAGLKNVQPLCTL